MMHHLLRALAWQLDLTRSSMAVRIGNALNLLLVAAVSGMAVGYTLTGRRARPPEQDDEATPPEAS
jgi:hypothetical protein